MKLEYMKPWFSPNLLSKTHLRATKPIISLITNQLGQIQAMVELV